MRVAATSIMALFMLCAASPPEPPPIPDLLKPYVKNGKLDPGDFAWMRGAFSDASPEDKAAMAATESWAKQCLDDGAARTRAELAKMGFADPHIDPGSGAPLLCRIFIARPVIPAGETYAQFREALGRALPMAQTYLTAVETARASDPPEVGTFSMQLKARPLAEQMLRRAMTWGQGELKDAPPLTDRERSLFAARLLMAMEAEDYANTEWLKTLVAAKGWPKISEMGDLAAIQAWLLAQHADDDPVFQLQVLRLMEPLVPKGEVSKSNYAYLYDRIMLKLSGKQRYATQMSCEKGKRMPMPVEEEAKVEALRKDMGMPSLAEYMKGMEKSFGPCPMA